MKKPILIIFITLLSIFAADTLHKKDGTKEEVKVIEVDSKTISYRKLHNLEGPLYKIKRGKLQSITYENGTIETFGSSDTVSHTINGSLSLLAGSFGLFNVETDGESEFTKGLYSIGLSPSVDYRISKHFAIGSECMVFWGKPKGDDQLRFIINPNILTRIIFPMKKNLTLETIIAGGLSFWPENSEKAYIHPTLNKQRQGWNIRGAFGADYKINEKFSLLTTIGYSASSSVNDDIWITHDFMLVTLGGRFQF